MSSPWEDLRGGLALGSEALWEKVKTLLQGREGREEAGWIRREVDAVEQSRKLEQLLGDEPDKSLQIWLWVNLGQRPRIEVARMYGYRDGSAITQILKGLDQSPRNNSRERLEHYKGEYASCVKR